MAASTLRVAVVTGWSMSKGIDCATLKELCNSMKFDDDVYLTSPGENKAVAELENLEFYPYYHQLDLNDESSILNLRDYLASNYGGLNLLINNASISNNEADNDAQILLTNLSSIKRVCDILFPILRPHARVLNVLSSCTGRLSSKITKNFELERSEFASPHLTYKELTSLIQNYYKKSSDKRGDDAIELVMLSPYDVLEIVLSAQSRIQQRHFDQDFRPGIIVESVYPVGDDAPRTNMNRLDDIGGVTIEQGAVAHYRGYSSSVGEN